MPVAKVSDLAGRDFEPAIQIVEHDEVIARAVHFRELQHLPCLAQNQGVVSMAIRGCEKSESGRRMRVVAFSRALTLILLLTASPMVSLTARAGDCNATVLREIGEMPQ